MAVTEWNQAFGISTRIGEIQMLKVILISMVTSFVVSFCMMKFQMKMIGKWMDNFFKEELKFIEKSLNTHTEKTNSKSR